MTITVLVPFVATLIAIYMLRPIARRIGLTDHPGGRKKHLVPTPLVGGISIYFGMLTVPLIFPSVFDKYGALFLASGILLVIGILDDKYDVPAFKRILAQVFAGVLMISLGGVQISNLGNCFGAGDIELGLFAVPFTLIAVIGGINAINMSDGLDGLSSGLILIALIALGFIAYHNDSGNLPTLILIISMAVLAFWVVNFRFPWRSHAKVFMGDAGTMVLGFVLVWLLVDISQSEEYAFPPALALWILAVPLTDTISVIIKRLKRKASPFSADREHLHHILRDCGFTVRKTVLCIYGISVSCTCFGLFLYKYGAPDYLIFFSFCGFVVSFLIFEASIRKHSWISGNLG